MFLAFLLSLAIQDPPQIANIGPAGKITKLHGGFRFADGPAPDGNGNVYFSDFPAEKIYKIDDKGKLSVFIEKSNSASGLKVSPKGELFACEMAGQIVAYNLETKQRRVVVDKFEGVYFTDPAFGAPKALPQEKLGVYYVSPDGRIVRVIEGLPNPNGIALSLDETTLFVVATGQKEVMAYPIDPSGKFGPGKVFCSLKVAEGKKNAGGDGVALDAKGNLYIASSLGVQVFDPQGHALGIIAVPEQPSHMAFGGNDLRTLYVTARSAIYAIPMEAAGPK